MKKRSFISPSRREYVLYKGGYPFLEGTIKSIAEQLGVKEETVRFYGSPTYARRTSENAMRLVEITGWDKDE